MFECVAEPANDNTHSNRIRRLKLVGLSFKKLFLGKVKISVRFAQDNLKLDD